MLNREVEKKIKDHDTQLEQNKNKTSQFVNAKEFGVIADYNKDLKTGTDNTDNLQMAIDYCINNKKILLLDGGYYKITKPLKIVAYHGFKMCGCGFKNTLIYQSTSNISVLDIIGESIKIESLGLCYETQQISTNISSKALCLTKVYNSTFDSLQIFNSCIGIGGKGDSDGNGYNFSNTFNNIEIQATSKYAIDLSPFPIGGTGNTGSVFNNIYVNNQTQRGSETLVEMECALVIDSMAECVFNQFNVEWAILKEVVRITDSTNIIFNSMHVEGCQIKDNIHTFRRVDGFTVDGLTLATTKCIGSWKFSLFYIEGKCKGLITNVKEVNTNVNGKQTYKFYSIADNDDTHIEVKNLSLSSNFVNDRMDNNSIIIYNSKRVFNSIDLPTTGKFKKCDRIYKNEITDGYVGYICTREGRTGVIRKNSVYVDAETYMVLQANNGRVYKAKTNGVTSNIQPIFNGVEGENITDGTVIWVESGISAEFKKFGKIE